MKAMQNDWYKKREEHLPDFFTSSSSKMWEKGRSKDSDFPSVCLCRGCVWEENTV